MFRTTGTCFSKCKEISSLKLHFYLYRNSFYKDVLVFTLFVVVNITPTETKNKSCSTKQITLKAFDCIVQCCTQSTHTLTQLMNIKTKISKYNATNTGKENIQKTLFSKYMVLIFERSRAYCNSFPIVPFYFKI